MDIRVVVSLNVQRLRRERGISQEELSLRSNCTRGYLSGIETGRRNPSVLFIEKLAKALNVDFAEFFIRPAKKPQGSAAGGSAAAGQKRKTASSKA
jgi:transcriptional regulator with XRE-family HTH domain